MAEIISAQEAIDVALEFMVPHYPWSQPVKAVRENSVWVVEFDVGAIDVEIATVKIDAATREIREFTKARTTA